MATQFPSPTRPILLALLLASLLWMLWMTSDLLLLIFGGVLLAVLLRGLADRLADWSGMSCNWALAVVILVLLSVLTAALLLIGTQVATQFNELWQRLDETFHRLLGSLETTRWGHTLAEQLRSGQVIAPVSGGILGRVTGIASAALNALANFVLILFLGLYLAGTPRLYRDGALRLVPHRWRPRATLLLDDSGQALWHWLVGKAVAMLVIGIATTIGLSLLGVPLALALGVLAGLLEFIPMIGPIIAAVPAVLIAFTESPTLALYVVLFNLGLQQMESYVLSPMVERWATSLPPAIALTASIGFGVLFGPLGLLFGTPLAVAAREAIRICYVEPIADPHPERPRAGA